MSKVKLTDVQKQKVSQEAEKEAKLGRHPRQNQVVNILPEENITSALEHRG